MVHSQRALDISEKSNGPKHDTPLFICDQLRRGLTVQGPGKYPEAETMFRQAFEGLMTIQSPDSMSTLRISEDLEDLLRIRGQLDEFGSLLRKAVVGGEKFLLPLHPMRLHGRAALEGLYLHRKISKQLPKSERKHGKDLNRFLTGKRPGTLA